MATEILAVFAQVVSLGEGGVCSEIELEALAVRQAGPLVESRPESDSEGRSRVELGVALELPRESHGHGFSPC